MLTQDNDINSKYVARITPESMSRERERLRSLARHNEAAALRHARDEEAWAVLHEDELNAAWIAWSESREVIKIEGLK